jgi:ADP-ribosylation factor-like protein 3
MGLLRILQHLKVVVVDLGMHYPSLQKNDKELRLLVLGLDNAGKTTALKQLSEEDITQVMPTQGFNMKTIARDGIKLNMWDIGGSSPQQQSLIVESGQKAIRQYWSSYFRGSDGLVRLADFLFRGACLQVYVIDSTDKKRLEETSIQLASLLEVGACALFLLFAIIHVQEPELSGLPILVFANKQDMALAMLVREVLSLPNK